MISKLMNELFEISEYKNYLGKNFSKLIIIYCVPPPLHPPVSPSPLVLYNGSDKDNLLDLQQTVPFALLYVVVKDSEYLP